MVIAAIITALMVPGLSAQAKPNPQQLKKAYSKAYTAKRFNLADTDGDGVVSRAEAGAEARPVEKKYFGSKRFNMADRNKDGVLTLEEAAAQKRLEKRIYRFVKKHPRTFKKMLKAMAKNPKVARRIGALSRKDPQLAKALARASLKNPQVTSKVVRWMVQHPVLAKKLITKAHQHPRVAKKLARRLAQDIFVKCYLAAPRYKPSAKFKTWLFRIARNHCLNEVRRQDYRYRVEPLQGVQEPDMVLTPEQLARARALEAEVQRVMGDLPESQRTALLLSRFQAMSYADIAQTMETSVSAVKSLLNRAKGTLLRRLSGHLETCHEV